MLLGADRQAGGDQRVRRSVHANAGGDTLRLRVIRAMAKSWRESRGQLPTARPDTDRPSRVLCGLFHPAISIVDCREDKEHDRDSLGNGVGELLRPHHYTVSRKTPPCLAAIG